METTSKSCPLPQYFMAGLFRYILNGSYDHARWGWKVNSTDKVNINFKYSHPEINDICKLC